MFVVFQEIKKEIKELQQACDDIKKEIIQRQLEVKTLKKIQIHLIDRQVSIDSKE
jgi:flagellar biosynthesis component FlhA